jgi:hypothetical protein
MAKNSVGKNILIVIVLGFITYLTVVSCSMGGCGRKLVANQE